MFVIVSNLVRCLDFRKKTQYFYLAPESSTAWPEMNQQFSKEIEDEANGYFQRIYNQPPNPTLSVDDVRLLYCI